METDNPVQMQLEGEIAVLVVDDGKVNAMSSRLLGALARAVDDALASDARAMVVTGNRKAFSAGLALPELIDLDRPAMARFIDEFAASMRRVLAFPRPTVAAVNGHAIAGGCVLALMCDARIATSGPAKIGLNEVQLGIGLPAIVVEPLRARVPPTSLTTIALEGALVEPGEALRLGIVESLAAPDELRAAAIARAKALATAASAAYAQVKQTLLRPVLDDLARTERAVRDAWLDTWFSDDAQERLRAAVAKLRR